MSLTDVLDGFEGKKILVIGDLMMDEFLWGDVDRISPEAPVPVVKVTRKTRMPGGAGNVVNNLTVLGAQVLVVGLVGKDAQGRELTRQFKRAGVNIEGIVVDSRKSTTVKTRIIAKSQHVVRVDSEVTDPKGKRSLSKMITYLKNNMREVDALTISDYGKGVVCAELLEYVIPAARALGIPIVVDPKVSHFATYKGVTVIAPNEAEASNACSIPAESEASVKKIGCMLLDDLDLQACIITRGSKGISLFEKNGKTTHIPAHSLEVFDVTGAGDTVTSVLTLSLACRAGMPDAARLANFAAGVVVGKIGTATVTLDEIKKELDI